MLAVLLPALWKIEGFRLAPGSGEYTLIGSAVATFAGAYIMRRIVTYPGVQAHSFYSYRHIVRPGITGWAQVQQGYAAQIDAVTGKLHYDFFYIKHFSPWLDLLIIARTIRTVVTGFGAR